MSLEQFSVETDDGNVILFCIACGLDIVMSEAGFTVQELVKHTVTHRCAEMSTNG